jgi:DNA-binding NarL/FixJ family response regulator
MAYSVTKFARRPASTSLSRRSADTKHDHVLIVAAETSTREFVDSVLRQAGYATARALDPPEALGMEAQFGPFDLLVTGAVIESRRLAWQLRQIEPSLKVLYLTRPSDPRSEDEVTSRDNELFLDTSVTAAALLEAVSTLLSGKLPQTDDSCGR